MTMLPRNEKARSLSKHVPFFANRKDDLHCFQASLKIVLKYFLPTRTFSFRQLEWMTGFKKGLWTWPMRGVLSMMDLGFTVRDIEDFDYAEVGRDAKTYLCTIYGEKTAKEQIANSDIPREERAASEFASRALPELRIPEMKDIEILLNDGYLVLCLVNSKVLNGKRGYVGHSVVLFRVSSSSVWFHDPGLPPRPNRRVSRRIFERAWGYPNEKAKNIIAFRL